MTAALCAAGRQAGRHGQGTLMHSHMAEFTAQVLKTEVSFLCAIIPVTYCYGKSVQCSTSSNNAITHVWLFVKCSNFVPTQHSHIYENMSNREKYVHGVCVSCIVQTAVRSGASR